MIKENHPDIDLLRIVEPFTGKTLNQYFKELEENSSNLGTRGFYRCVRANLQGNYSTNHPSLPSDKTFSRKEIVSMCIINNTELDRNSAAKGGYLYIGDIFSKEIE